MIENRDVLLDALERIARARPSTDWAFYGRVMAQLHLEDTERSDAYRAEVMPLLEAQMHGVEGIDSAGLNYVRGAYAWRFGDQEGARAYFTVAQSVEWQDESGEAQTGSPYIDGLIEDVQAGVLDDEWGVRAE